MHTPTPEDLVVGTNYARDGYELQFTLVMPGPEAGVVMLVPDQPMALSTGPFAFERQKMGEASVRVLTWK